MPISNSCFLEWSERLLSSSDTTETDSRIIVSRAYYSAYHEALALADGTLNLGVSNMSGGAHLNLSEALSQYICEDKELQGTIRRLGSRMHTMHGLRVRADYFFDKTVNKGEARSQVKNVRSIFSIIENDIKKCASTTNSALQG